MFMVGVEKLAAFVRMMALGEQEIASEKYGAQSVDLANLEAHL
jgi:hypothetical protein